MEMFNDIEISCEALTSVEHLLIVYLQWRTVLPTPCEIVKFLLFYANPLEDYEALIDKANSYTMLSCILYETS
jgi:hypothetical protein